MTATVQDLYAHLAPFVEFVLDPQEGLLLIDFNSNDAERLTDILKQCGCDCTPVNALRDQQT